MNKKKLYSTLNNMKKKINGFCKTLHSKKEKYYKAIEY